MRKEQQIEEFRINILAYKRCQIVGLKEVNQVLSVKTGRIYLVKSLSLLVPCPFSIIPSPFSFNNKQYNSMNLVGTIKYTGLNGPEENQFRL